MSTALKVQNLRALLKEQFGSSIAVETSEPSVCVTGFEALDHLHVPQGAITEIVTQSSGDMRGGTTLLLYGVLSKWLEKNRAVLIDGKDCFCPKGLKQSHLDQLLWLRCTGAPQALKVADLVVRDGNMALVVLYLALNHGKELQKVPSTAWHRLQLLAEKSAVTLLTIMPKAQVSCARLRVVVSPGFPLVKLRDARDELQSELALKEERRRVQV